MEPDLDTVLWNLLDEERLRAGSTDEEQMTELRSRIIEREQDLTSEHLLQLFKQHISTLSEVARPAPSWMNTGCSPNGKTASSRNSLAGRKNSVS